MKNLFLLLWIFVIAMNNSLSQPLPTPACKAFNLESGVWTLTASFDYRMIAITNQNLWKVSWKFDLLIAPYWSWIIDLKKDVLNENFIYSTSTLVSNQTIFQIPYTSSNACVLATGDISSYWMPNFKYLIIGYTDKQHALLFTNQNPNLQKINLMIVPAFINYIQYHGYLANSSNTVLTTYQQRYAEEDSNDEDIPLTFSLDSTRSTLADTDDTNHATPSDDLKSGQINWCIPWVVTSSFLTGGDLGCFVGTNSAVFPRNLTNTLNGTVNSKTNRTMLAGSWGFTNLVTNPHTNPHVCSKMGLQSPFSMAPTVTELELPWNCTDQDGNGELKYDIGITGVFGRSWYLIPGKNIYVATLQIQSNVLGGKVTMVLSSSLIT